MARPKKKPAPESNTDEQDEVQRWKNEIEKYDREHQTYIKRCEAIVRRYRDERDSTGNINRANDSSRRMNLLWSNVQTLKPSIYAKPPVPVVERRFLDRDDTGRIASQILERALRYNMEDSGFHDSMQRTVLDYLLPGLGQCWLRYEPYLGSDEQYDDDDNDDERDQGKIAKSDVENDSDNQDDAESPNDQLKEQNQTKLAEVVCVDYVFWKDFKTFPVKARTWHEVEAVSRTLYMSRGELKARFGDKIGNAVPLDRKTPNDKDSEDLFNKATVYEIWNKPERCVYFIAKEYRDYLEEPANDPLGLECFWPCPRPLYSTLTNDTLIPVPDFIEYQDQALEIDNLTMRINLLARALKVSGVYDASAKNSIGRLLNEDAENKLIPVDSWAAFAEKGGLQGAISWMPIEQIASVMQNLVQVREAIKQDLYEVTGMSDVIRGQSDPNETATAQAMKGQFASRRLRERQLEIARFCRDVIRIMGEIIAEHFSDDTLIMASGIMNEEGVGPEIPPMPQPPQPPQTPPVLPQDPQALQQIQQQQQQYAQQLQGYQQQIGQIQQLQQQKQQLIQQAIALLRQDKLRGFRLDIETDIMIADDAEQDKNARIGFITAVSQYLQQAIPAGQAMPELVSPLTKMLQFGIRGFRVGRDLEQTFEEFADKMTTRAKQAADNPQAQQPSPEQIKLQASQIDHDAEIQRAQIEAQSEKDNGAINQQTEQIKLRRTQLQRQIEQEKQANEAEYNRAQHFYRMRELQMKKTGKTDEEIAADNANAMANEQRTQAHEHMMMAMADSLQKLHAAHAGHIAQLQNMHNAMQGHMAATAQHLDGIRSHLAAPVEIIRDRTGRAIGAKKVMPPNLTQTVQ